VIVLNQEEGTIVAGGVVEARSSSGAHGRKLESRVHGSLMPR
jgi:hypothetical protein